MPVWLQVAVPLIVAIIGFVGGRVSVRASRDIADQVDIRADRQQQHEYLRWALERSWSSNEVEARAGLAIVRSLRLHPGLDKLDKRVAVAALHEINRRLLDQLGDARPGVLAPSSLPGDAGVSGQDPGGAQ